MARSAAASALLAAAALACAGSGGANRAQERFQLVRIGSDPVPRPVAPDTCDPAPVAAWYRFRGDHWESTDTVAGCNANGRGRMAVTAAAGHVERRGDTLRFYVPDSNVGVHGLVDLGWRRGDTLVVSGGAEEGGDFTFIRRR